MNIDKAVVEQALEAWEAGDGIRLGELLRQALEQPADEPLCTAAMFDDAFLTKSGLDPNTPLYTRPQPAAKVSRIQNLQTWDVDIGPTPGFSEVVTEQPADEPVAYIYGNETNDPIFSWARWDKTGREGWDETLLYTRHQPAAQLPKGVIVVSEDFLLDIKQRVNTLATLSLKRERYEVAISIKQDIADKLREKNGY